MNTEVLISDGTEPSGVDAGMVLCCAMDELLVITEVARIAGVLLFRRVEDNALSIQQISVIFSSFFLK